jgi:hypothetical protein
MKIKNINLVISHFQLIYISLLILGLFYILPLLISDRYYVDDINRSISGFASWTLAGRPFATFLMSLLNFSSPFPEKSFLIDISPLPQILAIVILAFGATILYSQIFKEEFDFYKLFVVFPIIGSPYLLHNLSYKFDAFPMAVSITCAIAATTRYKKKYINVLIGFFLLFIVLCTYQPAINIFLACSFLLLLVNSQIDYSSAIKEFFNNIIKFLIAALFYKIIFLNFYNFTDPYAASHNTLVEFDIHGIRVVYKNLKSSSLIAFQLFKHSMFFTIFSLVSVSTYFIYAFRDFSLRYFLKFLTIIISVVFLLLSIFGILLFLKNPVFQLRVFMGFSIFLVFIFYCFYITYVKRFPVLRFVLIIPILYFFFISYGYGAAARNQTTHDYLFVSEMITKLKDNGFKSNDLLFFDGSIPKSGVLMNSSKKWIINKLISPAIGDQSFFSYLFLKHFLFNAQRPQYIKSKLITNYCMNEALYISDDYMIFYDKNMFLVSFANGRCFKLKR